MNWVIWVYFMIFYVLSAFNSGHILVSYYVNKYPLLSPGVTFGMLDIIQIAHPIFSYNSGGVPQRLLRAEFFPPT